MPIASCWVRWPFCIAAFSLLFVSPTLAQLPLRADDTLGNRPTRVTPTGGDRVTIEGGVVRDRNLFHSFDEFNINSGERVDFANPLGIDTIFSRVTGRNPSRIRGTLGVLGNADLFLLNPNGIVFSETAQLDIPGAFLATTADRILFADDQTFSATNPADNAILSVTVPIGLQFGSQPGSIINRAQLTGDGQHSRILAGGAVVLDGGSWGFQTPLLQPAVGRIEMGAFEAGTINLAQQQGQWSLQVPTTVSRANMIVRGGSLVGFAGNGGGQIALYGRDLVVREESIIALQLIAVMGGDPQPSGDIVLDATGRVAMSNSSILNDVGPGAVGESGDVRVRATTLVMREAAQINTDLLGRGSAGNVSVVAGDRVQLFGTSADGQFPSGILSRLLTGGQGSGGEVRVRTPVLELRRGGVILTSSSGQGNAGDIRIQARDRVLIAGAPPINDFSSRLSSGINPNGNGLGGTIEIMTGQLEVRRGGSLSSDVFGVGNTGDIRIVARDRADFIGVVPSTQVPSRASIQVTPGARGNAGTLSITTPRLSLRALGQLNAIAAGQEGNAGDMRLQVRDRLLLDRGDIFNVVAPGTVGSSGDIIVTTGTLDIRNGGQIVVSSFGSGNAGEVRVEAGDRITLIGSRPDDPEIFSGIFSTVEAGAIGEGGNITLQSPQILIDEGTVTTRNFGTGPGGDIQITADTLELDTIGEIFTDTLGDDGGNIRLDITDVLLLRDTSAITTEAGRDRARGDGGDITINIPDGFIVAVPNENSDLIANAFEGRGGNIRITTRGIYGLEFRDTLTPQSDITASSEVGVDGTVEIITPGVDPTQGLASLPTDIVDAANQIGRVCPSGSEAATQLGRFVITGRGGIVPSPVNILHHPDIPIEWLDAPDIQPSESSAPPLNSSTPSVQEANTWITADTGRVQLVATAPTQDLRVNAALIRPGHPASSCP